MNQSSNKIEFSFFSIAKKISYSKIQITNKFLYSNDFFNVCQGGLLDSKMGSNKKNFFCEICKENFKKCFGHFGYLKLFLPVFNIGYLKTVHIILQLICKSCSKILIEPGEKKDKIWKNIKNLKKKNENNQIQILTRIVQKYRKSNFCYNCFSKNGTIKKNGNFNFIHEINYEQKNSLTDLNQSNCVLNFLEISYLNPLSVFILFQQIKTEELEFLDMDKFEVRPENLLICYVPIPPISLRPSIFISETTTNEDDLTLKLSEIQFFNFQLKKNLEKEISLFNINENWNILQIECTKYLNSESFLFGLEKHSFKGLFQRLKGKNGRFRGNLTGKRVDFSGRTVISPDPNLQLNLIGFPIQMAMKLSFPEKVTKINYQRLQRNVFRGSKKFPGAIFLINLKKNKQFIFGEEKNTKNLEIKEGFKIERHLKNNDIILFNRQPSLHRISIMSHRIKIIFGKTFKFNECVCKPYNADFDGDEMNIHVPQTQKARAEAISILNLAININSPGTGEAQIAAIQDFLSASFLLTCKDQFFSLSEFGSIHAILDIHDSNKNLFLPSILKPLKLWTGKQIFSLIISINLKKKFFFLQKKNRSSIKNDQLFQKSEKIYSLNEDQCSPFFCPYDGWILFKKGYLMAGQIGKNSIGSGNKNSLINLFLNFHSYWSVLKCLNQISQFTSRWFSNYGFSFGIKEVLPKFDLIKKKKKLIFNCYNLCEALQNFFFFKKFQKKYSQKNPELLIQKIFGKLREDMGKNCFNFFDIIKNSGSIMVISGSKGSLINILQMSVCLGQQSIAGNRITKGFFKRVLPHFEIELLINNPKFKGFIDKNFYDGLNGIDFFFHSIAGREGLIDTAVKTSETGYLQRRMMKTLEDIIIFYDSSTRTSDGRMIQLKFEEDSIDPDKISFLNNYFQFSIDTFSNEVFCKNKKVEYFENLTFLRAFSFSNMDNLPFFFNLRNFYFSSFFFFDLNMIYKLSSIEKNCEKIKAISKKVQIHPGNCVGAIAAQSLGEPGTQMTLQTFHSAGVQEINITQGVPRINEIMNTSKNIINSLMKFNFLKSKKKENIYKSKIEIEKICLGEICEKIDFIFNPNIIYLDIHLKADSFLKLGINITPKKIIQIIQKHENFISKSRFFVQKNNEIIRIFPKNYKKKKNFSIFEIINLNENWKKSLSKITIFGFIESQGITVVQNFHFSSFFLKTKNFLNILKIDLVEKNTIYCSHIISIFETLGIEASRQSIILEIEKIFNTNKITINNKHLSLLADVMTYKGELLGITRYGLAKMKQNTFVLASFEKTIENLFSASIKNSHDSISGVSENIIIGKNPLIGTGIVNLINV
jgi:DNA-directed RNA polymerase III subunit RPC1